MDPNDEERIERLIADEIGFAAGPIVKLEGGTANERAAHAREITEAWTNDQTGPYFFVNGTLYVRDAKLATGLRGSYLPPSSYGKR